MKKQLLSQKQKAVPEEAPESSVDARQKKRGRVESKGVVDNSDEAELDAILNGLDAVGWGEEKKERKKRKGAASVEVDDDKKKNNGDKDKRKRVGKKSEKAEEEEHENMVREYKKKLFGL